MLERSETIQVQTDSHVLDETTSLIRLVGFVLHVFYLKWCFSCTVDWAPNPPADHSHHSCGWLVRNSKHWRTLRCGRWGELEQWPFNKECCTATVIISKLECMSICLHVQVAVHSYHSVCMLISPCRYLIDHWNHFSLTSVSCFASALNVVSLAQLLPPSPRAIWHTKAKGSKENGMKPSSLLLLAIAATPSLRQLHHSRHSVMGPVAALLGTWVVVDDWCCALNSMHGPLFHESDTDVQDSTAQWLVNYSSDYRTGL